ncbi:protein NRT1/ PTR FAMILY 7.1 [Arachis ipaensis]|uniref:Protein NRT1/ PTR FAMILY 7 n=1 Tax=Arachis hypogaea TaxID=3818 RepID=A0A6B9VE92_ARAHY|nr:protein NRT1/ PTR FAMILY 7.1 [Arachis ipaensis]XP_025680056.1 protein NRT1/ PTR FAMILY 7.1 [Arachis hypogaea]XP_025680057.1 protein NRT1/ PTR FAMILY 7.1 [Arachis hypogaea]QHN79255.1 Protein NRT1/ PTR FAMILY 7 [Arachis hypogaea]
MPFFTTIFLFKRQAYKVVQSYRQDLYRRIYFVNKFDAMGRLSCSERDVIPVKANQLFEVEGAKSAIKGSRKSLHSDDFIFMDKATPMTDNDEASPMKRWRLCTVTS